MGCERPFLFRSMSVKSPYRYHIVLPDKQVGPYDRRTIVGMRIKKLIDQNVSLVRSDGHSMTVAQLMMDRFEMADARASQPVGTPATGLWPTFLVNFGGGGWRGAGALGFTGRGELRFQGDVLRLTGQRKGKLFGSTQDRVKLPLTDIASVLAGASDASHIVLWLKPNSPLIDPNTPGPITMALDDADTVKELIELVSMGTYAM
jgi:hypothetical protein